MFLGFGRNMNSGGGRGLKGEGGGSTSQPHTPVTKMGKLTPTPKRVNFTVQE